MGFSLRLALRYMGSRKRAFISVSTAFAVLGVALGTAALAAVMSVTGGFRAQFQKKVLGVNAHVMVLRSPFREYREVMQKVAGLPGVIGVGPFVVNPMMVTHDDRTATGVLVKGVDPLRMPSVLDLPDQMVEGSLAGLRRGSQTDSRQAPPAASPPATGSPLPGPTRPAAGTGGHQPAGSRPPTPLKGDGAQRAQRPAPGSFLDVLRGVEFAQGAGLPGGDPIREAAPLELQPDDLPPGSVEPEGGYESELPDDDVLPTEVDPDPCRQTDASMPGIVLGLVLKQTLKAELGDCVQVTSPNIGFSWSSDGLRPAVAKQFKVIGVFEAGFHQYDSKLAYTDLHEAQAFYAGDDTVTGVEMKVEDVDRAGDVAALVKRELDAISYHVIDWKELNHGLFTALRIQQILMSLVLALIILVAAFTVIATLIMVVLDKKKEIAAIKAMGASDLQLLRAFLYQGMIIGLVGGLVGLGAGYALCQWIFIHGFSLDPEVYFIDHLPVRVRPSEFVLTGVFAVVACLGATLWPALHAARLRPAEAFREA